MNKKKTTKSKKVDWSKRKSTIQNHSVPTPNPKLSQQRKKTVTEKASEKRTPSVDNERRVRAMVLQARSAGIPGFLIAFSNPESPSDLLFHVQDIKLDDVLPMSASIFAMSILKAAEHLPKEQQNLRPLLLESLEEFEVFIADLGKKLRM